MNYASIVILLILALGLLYGYENGYIKTTCDFVGIYISMIISSLLNKPIYSLTYRYLSYYKFKGLRTVNIVFHRVVIYLLVFLVLFLIYEIIINKKKIKEYLLDKIIEASIISKLIGAIIGVTLAFVLTYNFIVLLLLPSIDILDLKNSKVSMFVLDNTTIVSNINNNVNKSEIYIKKINEKKSNSYIKNNKIINYLIKNEVISKNDVLKIKKDINIEESDIIVEE